MSRLFLVLLLGIIFSVVHADWTLSVRLLSYYKQYSVIETAGATGDSYCCCDCANTGFSCCNTDANTANGRCVVTECFTHFSLCAKQGSGSEICSSTTSPFKLNSTFTFSEGGTYGGLENPIQLAMSGRLGSENIILNVSAIIQSNGGQTSQSIGYFTTSIPPRTIYNNTVSNTNTDPILSARLTYAYQLSCSPTSDCPVSSGTISISSLWILILIALVISATMY